MTFNQNDDNYIEFRVQDTEAQPDNQNSLGSNVDHGANGDNDASDDDNIDFGNINLNQASGLQNNSLPVDYSNEAYGEEAEDENPSDPQIQDNNDFDIDFGCLPVTNQAEDRNRQQGSPEATERNYHLGVLGSNR